MKAGYVCIFSPTLGQDEQEHENEGEQEQKGRYPPVDVLNDTNERPFNLGSKDHYLRNLRDTDFTEICGYKQNKSY